MLDHQSPTQAASVPPVIVLTPRQEAFCQAMACGVGGAEAARQAGYSPKGAKQRAAVLMGQPEIRVRIDQLRTDRRDVHKSALDRAAELVETIAGEALERKSLGLAMRAVELGLKLRGVIQDKRIPHHYLGGDRPHPDADLENLDCPPEDADYPEAAQPPAPEAAKPAGKPAVPPAAKRNSDLSARKTVTSPKTAALFGSTSLSAPVPPLRVPAVA
ncbi:terminase small subunit [Skermanella mucosa]|uniref:terminase small subunit n=1 Tax=Skermanella mucosa TaxID=1789672 RepID=UPI00192AACA5|nr:terminase small subunit [Skermanella mucosa]UEM22217.1 terminase small subunit [Skermanella mucosa]